MFFWEMSSWLEYEVVFWDILRYFEMVIPGTSEWQKKVVIRRVELGIGAPEFLGPRQWWKVTGARGFPTGRGVLGRTVIWIIHEVWGIPFYPIISHYIEQWYEGSHSIPFIFMPYFSSLVLYPLSFAPLIPYMWGPLCKIHRLQYWEVFPTKNTVSTLGAEYSYQSSDTPESYGWSNTSQYIIYPNYNYRWHSSFYIPFYPNIILLVTWL